MITAFLSVAVFILLISNIVTFVLYKEEQRRAEYLEERRKSKLYGKPFKYYQERA